MPRILSRLRGVFSRNRKRPSQVVEKIAILSVHWKVLYGSRLLTKGRLGRPKSGLTGGGAPLAFLSKAELKEASARGLGPLDLLLGALRGTFLVRHPTKGWRLREEENLKEHLKIEPEMKEVTVKMCIIVDFDETRGLFNQSFSVNCE